MPAGGRPGAGDGLACQLAAFAAALTTSISRRSCRCLKRNAIGSALTWAAISSMNDSWANVFCSRLGERKGPVKNGERMVWVRTRSLLTRPVPPQLPRTQPVTYDGAVLLPLLNPAGDGAGVRGANATGSNPVSVPVMTLPGVS